ncbi:MAG TPA: glycosyltransferase, partial [Thermoanaerobaculia bacterium]|nr:glycosyltransferase [Thermoanaerobaculia bacterium]
RVVHQCGKAHVESTRAAWEALGLDELQLGDRVDVVPFIDDVPATLASSHLVVSRAGAITLAELCAAGRPSILVPLAIAAGHQGGNAAAMERAGAARVLAGEAATPERLAALLAQLFAGTEDAPLATLQRMADAARRLARPGAADAIVDRLAEVAR